MFLRSFRYEIALGLVVIMAFFTRLIVAIKEPYLHDWDERFHALVARNMMHHPFQPMLKSNPVIYHDPFAWCCNHIWLHKQPLFLWQISASLEWFGVSELAVRLPSIFMGSIMILLVYRIAFLLTNDKLIGLIAGLLLCFSHFHIEMITGIKGMDHNDVAMGFYTLASIWSFLEYNKSGKWYWAALAGLFAGCAILNKWLVGLFVFLCWGLYILISRANGNYRKAMIHFLMALTTCCLVFLPWQFYIMHHWPQEAAYVYEFNRRHITEALEGHSGSFGYYAATFPSYFSPLWFMAYPGLFILWKHHQVNKKLLLALGSGFLFVFIFFSFIVKTKVESHFFFVAPLYMIMMAAGIRSLIPVLQKKVIILPFIAWCCWLMLDLEKFQSHFSDSNTERSNKIHNAGIHKNLRQHLPKEYKVVINLPPYEDIALMFYQNDITAYNWWFDEKQLEDLARKKIPIAAFKDHGQYVLPDYIYRYPWLYIIDLEIK